MVRLKALSKIRIIFIMKSHSVFPIITNKVDEFLLMHKIFHTQIIHSHTLIKNVPLTKIFQEKNQFTGLEFVNWLETFWGAEEFREG